MQTGSFCLVPPGCTCEKGEATRKARGAQQGSLDFEPEGLW